MVTYKTEAKQYNEMKINTIPQDNPLLHKIVEQNSMGYFIKHVLFCSYESVSKY